MIKSIRRAEGRPREPGRAGRSGAGARAVAPGAASILAAAALFLSGAPAARGQDTTSVHLAVGTGAVLLEGEFGLEARAGVELRSGRLSVIARPMELAVLPGVSEPGYRWVNLSGGQRRCREVSTGRFARDTRCIDLEAEVGASAAVAWTLVGGTRPLLVGAGVRAGPGAGPYGTVRWRPVPASDRLSWHLQASAGPTLVRFTAGTALRL